VLLKLMLPIVQSVLSDCEILPSLVIRVLMILTLTDLLRTDSQLFRSFMTHHLKALDVNKMGLLLFKKMLF